MQSIVRGMNYKDSIRYKAGDIIVKNIFTCFNDISSKEHIANRIIILDELFSTNIRRFSGDAGLKHICNT
ncbi:MAG: hypothetical protein O3A66_01785, partial [Proteobacteria bacterium]|nr:hypothetical protein [Pseudomonadota bacterium]